MNKIPDWLKKYRIKTINELKKEFSKDYDKEEDWRERVPLFFIMPMDQYAGKRIVDLSGNFYFYLNEKPIHLRSHVFDFNSCMYSFAMIKKIDFNEKIIKLMKL